MYSQNNHVCVDYTSGTFGDFLRYLISLHDGFEKFDDVDFTIEDPQNSGAIFPKVACYPNKRINFLKANTIDKFYSEFNKLMPNNKEYRQVYKVMSLINNAHHSCAGVTWLTEGAVIDGVPFKWNYDDYNVIRQTDHKIIFVMLSPFSKYRDLFLERHKIWHEFQGRGDNKKMHLDSWTKNYMNHNYYPKHELNYEIEINNLLDKDDETYYSLVKFLNVKPLDNWKDYVNTFDRLVLSKSLEA